MRAARYSTGWQPEGKGQGKGLTSVTSTDIVHSPFGHPSEGGHERMGRLSAVVLRTIAGFVWHLPRNLLVLALALYRRLISPLYGPVCRFFPSCSAYAMEAVIVHGAVKGSWLAGRRLIRCHPWNSGGLDPVPAGGHDYGSDPARVPNIIQLNHPDKFLAIQSDAESREAA